MVVLFEFDVMWTRKPIALTGFHLSSRPNQYGCIACNRTKISKKRFVLVAILRMS